MRGGCKRIDPWHSRRCRIRSLSFASLRNDKYNSAYAVEKQWIPASDTVVLVCVHRCGLSNSGTQQAAEDAACTANEERDEAEANYDVKPSAIVHTGVTVISLQRDGLERGPVKVRATVVRDAFEPYVPPA